MATWRGKAICAGRRLLVMVGQTHIVVLGHLALDLLDRHRSAGLLLEDVAQEGSRSRPG